LMSAARGRDLNPSSRSVSDSRRQQQLNELLEEVQQTLGQVIEREKVLRDAIGREQQVLTQRSEELSRQWKNLEATRSRDLQQRTADFESRLNHERGELRQFETQLNERYQELAARASENSLIHRSLKSRRSDLDARATQLHLKELSLRGLVARGDAQQRQLKEQALDLEQREERNSLQLESIESRRKNLEAQLLASQQSQEQWMLQVRSRERLLNDLETNLTARANELNVDERHLKQLRKDLAEEQVQLKDSLTEIERRGQELDERFSTLAVSRREWETVEQTSRAAWDAARLELEQARQLLQQQNLELESRQQACEEQAERLRNREDDVLRRERDVQAAEQALTQREESVAEQSRQLFVQQQSLQSASVCLSELNAEQAALQSERVSLSEQLDQLNRSSQSLRERELQLQASEQELQQLRSELESQRRQREEDRNALEQSRQEFETSRQTFAQQMQELEESRKKLDERLADLEQAESALHEQQHCLAESQQALEQRQRDFDEREQQDVSHPAENSLSVSDQTLEQDRIALEEDKARVEEQARVLQLKSEKLEKEQATLEDRQAHLDAEMQNLTRLRTEIDAERSRDLYDREQLQQQLSSLDTSREELERQWNDLNQRRQEFQQAADSLPATSVSPEVMEQLQRLECELDETRFELENTQHELERVQSKWEESRAELEKVGQLEAIPARIHPVAAPETSDDESVESVVSPEPEPVSEANDGDDAARRLRQELATLFGYSASATTSPRPETDDVHVDEHDADEAQDDDDSPIEAETRESSPEVPFWRTLLKDSEEASSESSDEEPAGTEAEPLHASTGSDFGSHDDQGSPDARESEDDSIENYMKRLLARNRPSGNSPESSPVKPDQGSAPLVQEAPSAEGLANRVVEDSITVVAPVRKNRKLGNGEKEALRADLHSFRELANYSARSAVATSKVTKTSAIVRLMLSLSAVGWLATLGLLVCSHWYGDAYFLETLMIGGVTGMMTMLAGIRYWEVRQIAAVVSSQGNSPEADSTVKSGTRTDAVEDDCQGPLSFL